MCLHIAIVAYSCKGSALYRDQEGRFIRALVQTFPKSRPESEFIQLVDITLGDANWMKINVRHIISSHECIFRYNKLQELDFPWEVLKEVKSMDCDYGPVDFHRVASINNNAAICIAYSVDNMVVITLSELLLAVRQCIKADRLGLPAFCGDEDSDVTYRGGRIEDETGLQPKRDRCFADHMGIGPH